MREVLIVTTCGVLFRERNRNLLKTKWFTDRICVPFLIKELPNTELMR